MTKWLIRLGIVLAASAALLLTLSHLHMPCQSSVYQLTAPRPLYRAAVRSMPSLCSGGVDINTAALEELDKLPGIGPTIAQRIIDERETGGPFHYPEDLLCVRGIGEKTLEKLRSQICIP